MPWDDLTKDQKAFLDKHFKKRFSDVYSKRSTKTDNVAKTADYELSLKLDGDLTQALLGLPGDYAEAKSAKAQGESAAKSREAGEFKAAVATLQKAVTDVGQAIQRWGDVVKGLRDEAGLATDVPGIDGVETQRLKTIGDEILDLTKAKPLPRKVDLEAARDKIPLLINAKEECRTAVEDRRVRQGFVDAFARVKDALEAADVLDPAPFAKMASHDKLTGAIDKARKALTEARKAEVSTTRSDHAKATSLLTEVAKSPTVEDLRLACATELQEHKRKLAEIGKAQEKLLPEITRLGKLPEDTAEAAELMRAITAHGARLTKLLVAEDLAAAETSFDALKQAVSAMQVEETALTKAKLLREEALKAYDKMAADLKKARKIHAINPGFTDDVKAFNDADLIVQFRLHNKAFGTALQDIDKLKVATAKLLGRQTEFTAIEEAMAQANSVGEELARLAALAMQTESAMPEVVQGKARLEEIFNLILGLITAQDFVQVLALCREGIEKANQMIGLKDACATLELDRVKLEKRVKAAIKTVKGEFGKTVVDTEFGEQRALITASQQSWDALVDGGDVAAAGLEVAKLEKLCAALPPLALRNDAAMQRRKDVMKTYETNKTTFEDLWKVKPASDKMLGLYRQASADYALFQEAFKTAPLDFAAILDRAVISAKACLAEQVEDEKNRATAVKAYEARKLVVIGEAREALKICAAHVPDLDALDTSINATYGAAVKLAKAGKPIEALEKLEECSRIAASVAGQVDGATNKMGERKADFQKRFAQPLKDRLTAVRLYEDVAPGLLAAVGAAKLLGDEVAQLEVAEDWVKGLEKLKALELAVDALVLRKGDHDQRITDRDWLISERAKVKAKADEADQMRAVDRETEAAVARYAKAAAISGPNADRYAQAAARAGFAEYLEALNALHGLKGQHDIQEKAKIAANKAYGPFSADINIAGAMKPISPEFAKLVAAFSKAKTLFVKHYFSHDYVSALQAIPAYGKAAKALADKKGDYDLLLVQVKTDATQAGTTLTSTSPEDLKKQTTEEKLDLLNRLRGAKEELTPDQRVLQRKVYMAMDLDEDFLKVDEPRRNRLIDEIKKDKDLFEAKDDWGNLPVDRKLALLQKTLETECRIYDMPVPRIVAFEEPPGDLGSFNGGTGTIRINTHPAATFDDFHDTIDTIVHENAHNYQAHIVKKLREGLLQPGDPEYKQALMFAANSEPHAYVQSEEDPACYKKEPMEEHAWKTGGDVQKALKTAPPTL
ncbi:hypothetical protein NX862_14240 [Rhodobacter sp. KR11]|uniref:hypothetical protein n=1 Tax=Rhodobacter sp. KR11 TaxID=2974588 RepID=UPI0022214D6C|nr:hypothetical protein [Rhodobacter sp. KR11]MCW1919916.1 hypothetical protein [Rhodobacter sp. KR11]